VEDPTLEAAVVPVSTAVAAEEAVSAEQAELPVLELESAQPERSHEVVVHEVVAGVWVSAWEPAAVAGSCVPFSGPAVQRQTLTRRRGGLLPHRRSPGQEHSLLASELGSQRSLPILRAPQLCQDT